MNLLVVLRRNIAATERKTCLTKEQLQKTATESTWVLSNHFKIDFDITKYLMDTITPEIRNK